MSIINNPDVMRKRQAIVAKCGTIEVKRVGATTKQVRRLILDSTYGNPDFSVRDVIDEVNNRFSGSWHKYIEANTNLKWCEHTESWY